MLVMDANIWIDLDNGGLLDAAFDLPYNLATPDVVVDQELGDELGEGVCKRGVHVLATDENQQREWEELRSRYERPGDTDLYALLHARLMGTRLVTGDRHLREAAATEGVDVSGVLWLLDEMVARDVVDGHDAACGLQAMLDRGARLPDGECERRLLQWTGARPAQR